MLRSIIAFTALAIAAVTASTLQGSHIITPQDYYGLRKLSLLFEKHLFILFIAATALSNSPPACGMPYNQLNLARITAVQNMNLGSTCNLCLKVMNYVNTTKYIYVLAVDLGGNGLDVSHNKKLEMKVC